MKTVILATLVGSAAAFVPHSAPKASTAVHASAMDDLKGIAEKSNPVLKVSSKMARVRIRYLEHVGVLQHAGVLRTFALKLLGVVGIPF
jgi:hypothetical protein